MGARVLVAAAAAVLAAGCSGSGGGASYGSGGGGPSSAPPTTTPAVSGPSLLVVETDYRIALPAGPVHPGTVTFRVTNRGRATHALAVEGPGVQRAASESVEPGETTSLTVTLRAGSYHLTCPVDGHADLGMSTTLTVS